MREALAVSCKWSVSEAHNASNPITHSHVKMKGNYNVVLGSTSF